MYRGRGVSGLKSEIDALDRKRINDALDKHLEKSSPSTSRGLMNGREMERLPGLSTAAGKQLDHYQDQLSKNKCSDGESETNSEGSEVSGSDGEDTSWISWFCNLRGNVSFVKLMTNTYKMTSTFVG